MQISSFINLRASLCFRSTHLFLLTTGRFVVFVADHNSIKDEFKLTTFLLSHHFCVSKMPSSPEDEEVVEIPRGAYVPRSKFIHEVKESKASTKIVSSVLQSILFEINKTRFRVKHKRSPVLSLELKDRDKELLKKHSNRSILIQKQLTDQLSSALPSLQTSLTPSKSSPALCYNSHSKKTTLFTLDDTILLQIASCLDGKSVHMLSQTCKKFQTLLTENNHKLSKRLATAYEIVLCFNNFKKCVDVRALKVGRSLRSLSFEGFSIGQVIPKLINCIGKVTFGAGVTVSRWAEEVLRLYRKGNLTPISLIFTGGNLSKGSHIAGADLRGFTESAFIAFVKNFTPHLQEVQLSTAKLFRPCTNTAGLLSLISHLTSFGITYERPGLRYYFEDVRRVIANWRYDPLSRNSCMYMRYPRGSQPKLWEDCGGTIVLFEEKIERVAISHGFLEGEHFEFSFLF
ncbi:unnamed protein product [Auanema sp. JU1783]|nr:unnamed protein product [Auanema sp. JU1783]